MAVEFTLRCDCCSAFIASSTFSLAEARAVAIAEAGAWLRGGERCRDCGPRPTQERR